MSTTYEQERTEKEKALDAEVLERVKRGLKLLEEKHGPGWEDKIDMKTLELSDGSLCILGQVYGTENEDDECGYILACDEFWGEGSAWEKSYPADYGFNVLRGGHEWHDLDAAWRHVLEPKISAS